VKPDLDKENSFNKTSARVLEQLMNVMSVDRAEAAATCLAHVRVLNGLIASKAKDMAEYETHMGELVQLMRTDAEAIIKGMKKMEEAKATGADFMIKRGAKLDS